MKKYFVLTLILLGLMIVKAEAQEDSLKSEKPLTPIRGYIQEGVGSAIMNNTGLSLSLSLAGHYGEHVFALHGRKWFGFPSDENTGRPVDPKTAAYYGFNEFSIMYGVALYSEGKSPYHSITLKGGPALFSGIRRGALKERNTDCFLYCPDQYEEIPFSTYGALLEVSYTFALFSWYGFGVTAFTNINPEQSVFGIQFNALIGVLR